MNVDRRKLPTEARNPATEQLDLLGTLDAVRLIQQEDRAIHDALELARPAIALAIDTIAQRLRAGGRLFYVGAGTSGRLATLDAAECPPTFQSAPTQVQALIAGGPRALVSAVEGAEDDRFAAALELDARGLGANDVVLGIAAGGTTPFVHSAIEHARKLGATSIFLACVPRELAPDSADLSIRVVTGPEVLTGSTRLKAGTATKLVLNTISTLVMARLCKLHGNLMVALDTRGNRKLQERGAGLVETLTGLEPAAARACLEAAGGQVQVAVIMARLGLDARAAALRLASNGGSLRAALEDL